MRDLKGSHRQRVMQLYGQEPIKLSFVAAKIAGHRHCGSKDIDTVFSLQRDPEVMLSLVLA